MKRLGIYIGTCKKDIDRYEYLVNSIRAFNKDNIPIFTAVNDNDIELFKDKFKFVDYGITFYKDSDIYNTPLNISPWLKQQIIKMNFWRLNVCDVTVQCDSDSFFIKDFYIKDFMATPDIPYTIIHQNKELMEFFIKNNKFNPKITDDICLYETSHSIVDNCRKIREMYSSDVKVIYDYGHPPCIWDSLVWKKLSDILEMNNLQYVDILKLVSSEQQWYGETLIDSQLFSIYPLENQFKTFHYVEDFIEFTTNNSYDDIKYNYLGVCIQSNWCININDVDTYKHFFTNNEKIPDKFYSQCEEDKYIINNFKLPKNGVIIDVGADQPVFASNSYIFEKYLNWDCLCIDADTRVIDKLKLERKKVLHTAVSDTIGTVKFLNDPLPGISRISEDSLNVNEISCTTLNNILKKYNYNKIDILDIDVEGYELNVCKGLNWEKYSPSIVIIEYLSPNGNNYNEIIKYFEELPYKLMKITKSNLIFCQNDFIINNILLQQEL